MKRIVTLMTLFFSVFFCTPAFSQQVICCNQLIDVDAPWIGASRDCAVEMANFTQSQQFIVCGTFPYVDQLCQDVAPYCAPCNGDEPKKNNPDDKKSLGSGSPFMQGLVSGLEKFGVSGIGAEHIAAQDKRKKDGLIKFQIRLDQNVCFLPTAACVVYAGGLGLIPQGKQEGAPRLLIGSIQFAGNSVQVSSRIVNVETGVVEDAAKGRSSKKGRKKAISDAFSKALKKLDLSCFQARTLNF